MSVRITGGAFDLTLRLSPETMSWRYNLNTSKTDTYGGHVIQLLSVNVTDLQLNVPSGSGGIAYQRRVVQWFRDTSIKMRDGGGFCTFSYAPRNILLHVLPRSISMGDSIEDVRKDFVMAFHVVEDVNGALKRNVFTEELNRLASGIGYSSNKYNTPEMSRAGG